MNINNILLLGKKEANREKLIDYIYGINYSNKKLESYNGESSYKDSAYFAELKLNIMDLKDITIDNAEKIRKKAIDEVNKGEAYTNLNNRVHSIIYAVTGKNLEEFEIEDILRVVSTVAHRVVVAITDCDELSLEELEIVEKRLRDAVGFEEILRINFNDEKIDEHVHVLNREHAMRVITGNMWNRLRIRALGEAFEVLNKTVDDWKTSCDYYVHDKVNALNIKKTKANSEKIFTDMLNKELDDKKGEVERNLREYLLYFTKVDECLNSIENEDYKTKFRDAEIVYPEDLTRHWTGDSELDAIPSQNQEKATRENILEDINNYYMIVKRQIAIIMETYKNVLA